MLCITAQSIFYTFLIHTEFLKNVTSMQTEGRIYFVWFNTVEAVQFQKTTLLTVGLSIRSLQT